MNLPYSFKKHSGSFIVIFGLAGAVLNFLLNEFFTNVVKIPLYMDTMFTVAASFISPLCGLIACMGYEIITVTFNQEWLAFAFTVCSLTVVLAACLYKKISGNKVSLFGLAILSLVLIVLVAAEGGAVYYFLFENPRYQEDREVNVLTFSLFMNHIPILFSAMLARLPVSFLDKAIAVFGGFFIAAKSEALDRIKSAD